MKRLTKKFEHSEKHSMKCAASPTCPMNCECCTELDRIVNRLGAYEDTGLTPEQYAEYAGMMDAAARAAKHYKEQRNAAIKQLRRIADCDTCRHNQPCGVDSPKCVACNRGQAWEWDGGRK